MYENDNENILKAKNGDKEALGNLVTTNSGLIWSIVKRFMGRGYDAEDLYQIASIGFIKSIKRFDTSFNVKLSTYSVPYMIGEVKRHIRDDGMIKVSRSIKELAVKINELKKEYLIKGIELKLDEIADKLEVQKDDVILAMESLTTVESIEAKSFEDQKDGHTLNILDKISNNVDEEEQVINRLIVKKLLDKLQPRDRQVIFLRFFKEKTQTQVAKILGITQVQVSRIEKKILLNMRDDMKEAT